MYEQYPSGARGRLLKAAGAIVQTLSGVALTIEGWWERHRLRRELDDLERQGELERTLADSGIASSDLSRLLRAHPRTPEQLALMLRRLGIDRRALAGSTATMEALRAMEWRCGECTDWRQCRTWLTSRDAAGSYRAFCANAEALDTLRCSGATASEPPDRRGILAELDAAAGRQ